VHTASAEKELLAPRDDVWAFISDAGRLADWWPGIFAAQEQGSTWTVEGDEREGLTEVADRGDHERKETVDVEKAAPGTLRLRFPRSGYEATLSLASTARNRTGATLSIAVEDPHETLAERLEEVGGFATPTLTGPSDAFAASILEKLFDLVQTADDV
jgi:uncharacterized protein YndB with AHSA1/START domain